MNMKITEMIKVEQCLAMQEVGAEFKPGRFFNLGMFRRFVPVITTGKINKGKTLTVQLMQAKDESGTDSKPLGLPQEVTAKEDLGEKLHLVLESYIAELEDDYSAVSVQIKTNNDTPVIASVTMLRGDSRYYPV